jgi:hypothetical protein
MSEVFMCCVKKDREAIIKLRIEQEKQNKFKMYFIGFIVKLYEKMIELRQSDRSVSWIETQLKVDKLKIKPISIEEGKIIIKSINQKIKPFNNIKNQFYGQMDSQLPVLFFDECSQTFAQKETIEIYKLVRRSVRALDLIAIFMGTNANISNFVSREAYSNTRDGDDKAWCYIIFKISSVLESYIESRKYEIKKKLEESGIETNICQEINNLINQISKIIKNERPLFCKYIFDMFSDFTHIENSKKAFGFFDIKIYFSLILESIYQLYIIRKKPFNVFKESDCKTFSFSNLQLMAPEYWRKEVRTIDSLEKNSGIHGHIAHLYVQEVVLEKLKNKFNYFGLINRPKEQGNDVLFLGSYDGNFLEFKNEQIFSPFFKELIGQLAFTSNKASSHLFLDKAGVNKVKRISLRDFIKSVKPSSLFVNKDSEKTKNWTIFESFISMAALIATFQNNFFGISFADWLKYFLDELCSSSTFNLQLKCEDNDFNIFKDIQIPFCSSSLKAEWPASFANYLINDCNANLGIVDSSLDQESRDFVIKKVDQEFGIISGECKDRANDLTSSDIFQIMIKLNKFKTPINIIACSYLPEIKINSFLQKITIQSKTHLLTENEKHIIDQDISIYSVTKTPDNYQLALLYKNSKTSSKLFILIDASSL